MEDKGAMKYYASLAMAVKLAWSRIVPAHLEYPDSEV